VSPAEYPGITPVKFGVPKPRKILSMSHLLAGHEMKTHNNTLANLCRGVGERVLFTNSRLDKPAQPQVGIFEQRMASYRDQLFKTVGRQSPVTRGQFLQFYKGPRLATYKRAVDSLTVKSICPRDAVLKTFVKAEKNNLTLKKDYVPRVIQPRNPRFNVEIGCYLRPIEKQIYSAIDELFKGPTIMSEYNAYTQASKIHDKWLKFRKPICIGLDASRFDQHVSPQALRFEHSLYNKIYRCKKLAELLRMQIHNNGIAVASDGMFRYHVKGRRMSGDMNTSLGNKLLMCLMAKSYVDTLNVPVEFINNGDDCLLILEAKHYQLLDNLHEYFLSFGFNIVREEPVYEFEQIEFCQTRPVKCNGIWRMVRNVKTCISKDVTCVNLGHNVEEYRGWLRDVARCGRAVAGDVPVLGAFYRMLYRLGNDSNYSRSHSNEWSYYHRASRSATLRHESIDDDGRVSYYISTGITPETQLSLEEYFDGVSWGNNKRQLINIAHII
jgi:hypothetical protein